MNLDPKKLLISARYYATLPFRKAAMTTLCKDGMAPMMILFYHRVADDSPNDWTISNSLFKRQIDWARSRFEMVSLAEVQRRMHRGKNVRPTVSVTFDDGYQENCDQALPYLIEHNIPTTYFVTLDNIERNQPFPHDVKAGYPLCPNTPAQIRQLAVAGIDIGAHTRSHPDLGKIHDLAELRKEIVEPKQALEAMIETPVNYFAFPFGKQENMHTTAV